MQYGPNPGVIYSNEAIRSICFIKDVITCPSALIGDYIYYDDVHDPERFKEHVTHHCGFLGDRLIIGRFYAITKGIGFVMSGANHRMCSATTHPFNIMDSGWEKPILSLDDLPFKGDTIVGNDIWIGQNVMVMPGVHIGDDAIVAADSVVAKDTPTYYAAGGSPCRVIRKRLDDDLTEYLLQLQWWN